MDIVEGTNWSSVIWSAIIIFVVYKVYTFIIVPYRLYQSYIRITTSKYHTFVDTFNPFFSNIMLRLKSDQKKYGDSVHTFKNVFSKHQVAIQMYQGGIHLTLMDPELVRQYYEKVTEGYYIKSTDSLFISSFRYVIGNGLFFSEGQEWKNKKKVMSAVFNFDFIKGKINATNDICNQVLDRIEKYEQNVGKNQITMDVELAMNEIYGNVVIKFFFGNIQPGTVDGQNVFSFASRLNQTNIRRTFTLFALIIGPKFLNWNLRPIDREVCKMNKDFNIYASKIINQQISFFDEKKKQNKSIDEGEKKKAGLIENLIMDGKLKKEQDGSKSKDYMYSVQDLIDEFKTFFFAGTQTTSSNTTALICKLAQHKDYLKQVRIEMDEVFKEDSQITFEKLKQLKFLQKCIKQTLRIYSPVPGLINRECTKDHYIGDIPINSGVVVSVCISGYHFRDEFFQNPEVFNPYRWDKVDEKDEKKAGFIPFIPFSLGTRICIGQHLAMIEMKIAVVNFLRRYKEIILEKPQFVFCLKTTYGPQRMRTTLIKS